MVDISSQEARKALIAVAIETVLLKMGKPVYDQVTYNLYKEYRCYIPDCYEHPEYLKRILQDLFGKSSATIVESIKKYLGEYVEQKGIDAFIAVISG
ncbi:MAG: hypothetical protein ACREA3_08550 [Nitrosotalea sp.]